MPKKILVVEDETNLRKAIHLVLENKYNVTSVENGEKALQVFQNEEFDLIISDIKMPGMSGIDLFKAVKKTNSKQKVIFVSVSSIFFEEEEAKDIIHRQCNGFLNKPFRIAKLEALIEKTLV